MSDYKLSTYQVRNGYCTDQTGKLNPVLTEQFDRWLAAHEARHYDTGAENERESIIKLLEDEIDFNDLDAQMMTIAWCIALIKGEQE